MSNDNYKDSWCAPLRLENGKIISGGAARNKRIRNGDGMDNIINKVAREAATYAANEIIRDVNNKERPKLKIVSND